MHFFMKLLACCLVVQDKFYSDDTYPARNMEMNTLLFLVYFFCQIGADGTAKQCLILKQSQTDASFASFTRFSVLGLFHASAEKFKHHIWKHLSAVKILPACSSKMNMLCLAVSHTSAF